MKYLIANWKMNSVDIDVWEHEFINAVSSQNNFPKSDEVKLIVCLNLYDYTVFSEKIKNSKNEIFNKISLFTQDVSQYDEGAFTGQISAKFLKKAVLDNNADFGIAFDGDGDRLIIVDSEAKALDGDDILFLLAKFKFENQIVLGSKGVVGTDMTNKGL